MGTFYKAIENIYAYKKSLIVLGLTGITGAGCTTVAGILEKEKIEDMDIKMPKTYDYNDSEERKQEIIYNFIKEEGMWSGFTTIGASAVIISFVLEKGFNALIDFMVENDSEGKIKLDNLLELKQDFENLKDCFEESKSYLPMPNDKIEEKVDEYYMYYTDKLPSYKKMFQDILSKHVCYPQNDAETKAQLYTYLMQVWGNNIRASGDPYHGEFTESNYYDVAKRIDSIISIIAMKKGNSSVRICIDALRNPYEAIYFKDNYKNFHLISISTEEKHRKSRLSFLSKKEQDALEKVECPEDFNKTEEQFFHQNIQACTEMADIHIYNPDVKNKKYYFLTQQIIKYIALILHPGLVTPTHLERCMQLAYNAKFNSGCLSRQVGAVITGDDFSIRAVGWNDVPKGQVPCSLRSVEGYCANKDCESFSNFELCDEEFDKAMKKIQKALKDKKKGGRTFSYCFKDVINGYKGKTNQVWTRALHAEENAFLQISKYGGAGIKGGFLFTTSSPCELCAKKAYQLGITNIYYIQPYPGISMTHVLSFGKTGNPKMNLFYGAIGNAYISLYEPRMALKDELELLTDVDVKSVVKEEKHSDDNEPVVSNIKYLNVELSLIYKSKEDISSIRDIELKVMGEPIDHIEKEIVWTGSEYKGTKLISNTDEYDIVDSSRKISPYKYNILFNKNIMKGQSVKYVVKTSVSDLEEEMQPFFSHTVKNPTEKLTLIVKFPKGYAKGVTIQEYRDSEREIPVGDFDKPVIEEEDEMEKYIYKVKTPVLFRTYCIQWVINN